VSTGARIVIALGLGLGVAAGVAMWMRRTNETSVEPSSLATPQSTAVIVDASLDAESHAADGLQQIPAESHLAAFYGEATDETFSRATRPEIEGDVTDAAHRTRMLVESIECHTATCIARLSTTRDDLSLAEVRAAFDHPVARGCVPELVPSFIPDAGLSSLDILFHCRAALTDR
jgi:hypothetical protein